MRERPENETGAKMRLNQLSTSSILLLALALALPANAQQASSGGGCNLAGAPAFGLRTPLVNGASYGAPFVQAPAGRPPAIGDGACPAPVVAGHTGAPTLLPQNPDYPTDHLGTPTFTLNHDPANQSMPGQLGPSYSVPPPPSTPGCDPGMISGPMGGGCYNTRTYTPPVTLTNINPGGGISASAPTQKWGGQTTTDWGRYKYRGTRSYDWGQQASYGQLSTDGPYQSLPGAMATQDLYGQRGYTRSGCTTMTIAPY